MSRVAVAPVRGRLFHAKAAAEYLGVPESRLRAFIRRGELACVKSSTGRLEGIYESDCDVWIATHRQVGGVTPSAREIAIDERMKTLLPKERVF